MSNQYPNNIQEEINLLNHIYERGNTFLDNEEHDKFKELIWELE